jgi:hypothetical protein
VLSQIGKRFVAHGQTSVNDAIRQRRESRSVLEIQGVKMRARGQTQAQIAARDKVEAETTKKRKYAKNHRSAIDAREHPAAPKPIGKAAPKATGK